MWIRISNTRISQMNSCVRYVVWRRCNHTFHTNIGSEYYVSMHMNYIDRSWIFDHFAKVTTTDHTAISLSLSLSVSPSFVSNVTNYIIWKIFVSFCLIPLFDSRTAIFYLAYRIHTAETITSYTYITQYGEYRPLYCNHIFCLFQFTLYHLAS